MAHVVQRVLRSGVGEAGGRGREDITKLKTFLSDWPPACPQPLTEKEAEGDPL